MKRNLGWWSIHLQAQGPEFKPHYHQKKNPKKQKTKIKQVIYE
jgi:hypothetical protein